jgi:hypothetical protein
MKSNVAFDVPTTGHVSSEGRIDLMCSPLGIPDCHHDLQIDPSVSAVGVE